MKAPISSTTLTAIVATAKVVSAETEPRPKAARTPATKRIRPGSTRLYQPAASAIAVAWPEYSATMSLGLVPGSVGTVPAPKPSIATHSRK